MPRNRENRLLRKRASFASVVRLHRGNIGPSIGHHRLVRINSVPADKRQDVVSAHRIPVQFMSNMPSKSRRFWARSRRKFARGVDSPKVPAFWRDGLMILCLRSEHLLAPFFSKNYPLSFCVLRKQLAEEFLVTNSRDETWAEINAHCQIYSRPLKLEIDPKVGTVFTNQKFHRTLWR